MERGKAEVEELDKDTYAATAKYRKRKNKRIVDLSLPEIIYEHLRLKEKGTVGFRRTVVRGKRYIVVSEVTI